MYKVFLLIHQYLAWLTLVICFFAAVRAWHRIIFRKWWSQADVAAGIALTVICDLQLTAGIILYAGLSPVTKAAFLDFGIAMDDPSVRFIAVNHAIAMLLAVILVHAGSSLARKAQFSARKHRISAFFYSIALLVMIWGIPWDRFIPS
jgi:hypothetical protein